MIRRLSWMGLVFALATTGVGARQTGLSPAIADAVAWYDTFGFPDLHHRPYVRASTGLWRQEQGRPKENTYVDGFLIDADSASFTVFLCDVLPTDAWDFQWDRLPVTSRRFVRNSSGEAYERVEYEPLDLNAVTQDVLARAKAVTTPRDAFFRPFMYRAQVFTFGLGAVRNDLADAGAALMDAAANLPAISRRGVTPAVTLRGRLEQDFGDIVIDRAEIDAANANVSRTDLLKEYADFGTRFPESDKVGYARDAADTLRTMIAEDADHHARPIDQMSPAEQAAEYIFQLRDLGYVMWVMNSAYPDMAMVPGGGHVTTTIDRLVDLRYAAVPQLIDHLDDHRFTHALQNSFNGTDSSKTMRVSDVVEHILEHLSGRNFQQFIASDGTRIPGTVRDRVEAWWTEVEARGDRQVLVDAVSAGGQPGAAAARRLIQVYPDAAVDAIAAGMRATASDGQRSAFVEALDDLSGEAPMALLRSAMTPDNGLYTRVVAARILFRRGDADVVSAIIAAWRDQVPRLSVGDIRSPDPAGSLFAFLANSGDAAAIDALGENLQSMPVQFRTAAVDLFWPPASGHTRNLSGGLYLGLPDDPRPAGPATSAAIERVLVGLLDDPDRNFGMQASFDETRFADPRVRDMAALVLSVRWPAKYAFTWTTDTAACDAEIDAMRNTWRRANGLAPAAPAPRVTISPARAADLDPILETWLAADPSARDALTTQIVQTFGLGALAAVRARAERAGPDATFGTLAATLAGIVRDVRLDRTDRAPASLVSLKGQSLSADRFAAIVRDLESDLPAGTHGVTFTAERAGDGTGFIVTVDWIGGDAPNAPGWTRELHVLVANSKLFDRDGWTRADQRLAIANEDRDMANAVGRALAAATDGPVAVRVRLVRAAAPAVPR